MLIRIQVVLCYCVLFSMSAFGDDSVLNWEENSDGLLISEDGSNVLFYQRADKSKEEEFTRAHYVHPLYDLNGKRLTEDFPDDHLHHRGVFWAWHQLRVGDQVLGDGWALKDFRWDVRTVQPKRHDNGSISLDLLVHWKTATWRNGEEAVVVEDSSLTVYPREGDRRRIDFDIRIRAIHAETFIGGSDDDKGYGGFSVRLKLPEDIRFFSQSGPQTSQTTAVAPSPWMSMTGSLGDAVSDESSKSGLTVLCHPDSAGYPQSWILRSQRSMQNPVWPGRTPQLLSVDEPVVLRYRLMVHRHPVSPETIERWQHDYAAER